MLKVCYMIVYIFLILKLSFCDVCDINGVHALILARGGSKGIPLKNLADINGYSILAKTIITLKKSRHFIAVWVSTDNIQIAKEAVKYGASVHRRSAFFAQDNATSLESTKEFLNAHPTVARFALFQCTSVFLNTYYIYEAMRKYQERDCVFAVKRSYNLRWKAVKGKIEPLNFDPRNRPRRQDWDGELVEAGMFYFTTRKMITESHFQNERCAIIVVSSKDSLEVDTIDDLHLLRCMYNI